MSPCTWSARSEAGCGEDKQPVTALSVSLSDVAALQPQLALLLPLGRSFVRSSCGGGQPPSPCSPRFCGAVFYVTGPQILPRLPPVGSLRVVRFLLSQLTFRVILELPHAFLMHQSLNLYHSVSGQFLTLMQIPLICISRGGRTQGDSHSSAGQ